MAIGEFVGLITNGIKGLDVMVGGHPEQSYQIFQGRMGKWDNNGPNGLTTEGSDCRQYFYTGNFTRFINHSCYPNSQFQRFYWRGIERIIVVSRGVASGSEITVDYSDYYWKQLNKACLCGEPCCRFPGRLRAD